MCKICFNNVFVTLFINDLIEQFDILRSLKIIFVNVSSRILFFVLY